MKSGLRRLIFFAGLLALWWALSRAGIWNSTLLPSPGQVLDNLKETFGNHTLVQAIASSMRRVAEGYIVSLVLGVPLGIMLARIPLLADTVGSVVVGLQSLPSICWLPLALLWFGLNDSAILFVVVMGSFVSIAISVEDGVRNLPPSYVRGARTLGVTGFALYTEVLLPASLPAILTGAKLGWAYAWRALMAGELLFVTIGLGRMLMVGRDLGDMSQVISVMLVIIAIGLFADRVIFANAESLVRDRFGLSKA